MGYRWASCLLANFFPPTLCVPCLPFLVLFFRVDCKLRKESLIIINMVVIRDLYEKVGFPALITSLGIGHMSVSVSSFHAPGKESKYNFPALKLRTHHVPSHCPFCMGPSLLGPVCLSPNGSTWGVPLYFSVKGRME